LSLGTCVFVLAAFGQSSSSRATGAAGALNRTVQLPDSGLAGAPSAGQPAPVSDRTEVVILRPAMAFSDYKTDAALSAERYGAEAYAGRLHLEAVERLQSLRIAAVDQEAISDPVARQAADLLEVEATRLARGVIAEGSRNALTRVSVAVNSNQALVFVHSMKVKLGPHRAWHSYGDSGPQVTTILIQAALISCRTGRVVWQGQGFRHDLPRINSVKFSNLMKDLYKGLTAIPR
jgi:hypothetical protein